MKKLIGIFCIILSVILVFSGCGLTYNLNIGADVIKLEEELKLTENEYNDFVKEFENSIKGGALFPVEDQPVFEKVVEDDVVYYVSKSEETIDTDKINNDMPFINTDFDAFFTVRKITPSEVILGESELSKPASYLKDANASISITFPDKIIATNGVLSNEDKTVTFNGLERGKNWFAATEKSSESWLNDEPENYQASVDAIVERFIDGLVDYSVYLYSDKSAYIEWFKVDNATEYDVYTSTNGSTWKKIGATADDHFIFKNLTPGKKNYFEVVAKNDYWSTELDKPIYADYVVPLNTKATASIYSIRASKNKALVKVKHLTGADGYIVYMSKKNKSGTFKRVGKIYDYYSEYYNGEGAINTFTKSLSKGKYYFKVKAFQKTATKTYYTSASSAKSVTIK